MSDDEDYDYYDSDEEVQEIEVDDEYQDDVEEEISQKEPDFVVLTIFDVIKKQQEEVEKITEVLGVSNASARVLLRKFGALYNLKCNSQRMESRTYHEHVFRKRIEWRVENCRHYTRRYYVWNRRRNDRGSI
jgi:hypothetical protein